MSQTTKSELLQDDDNVGGPDWTEVQYVSYTTDPRPGDADEVAGELRARMMRFFDWHGQDYSPSLQSDETDGRMFIPLISASATGHSLEDIATPAFLTEPLAAEPVRMVKPAVWHRSAVERDVFRALQRWEGVVLECDDETFLARLTDLGHGGPLEEAELDFEDVPKDDWDLVQEGAVFYWSIGYLDGVDGQRSRISTVRFRRLPVWSGAELDEARGQASHLSKLLGGE